MKAQGLCKAFEGTEGRVGVLDNMEFFVPGGSKVAVVGKSGSGKSTLLNIIGTLEKQNSGRMLYDDKEMTAISSNELADWRNKNIGFVFQAHRLMNDFSALENVMIPGILAGVSSSENSKRAEELLSKIGLSHRLKLSPQKLSGGEQQRVAVARALALRPNLLLADEPTGNLDSETGEAVLNLMLEETALNNATLVLVTHNRDYISKMDIGFELSDGKITSL